MFKYFVCIYLCSLSGKMASAKSKLEKCSPENTEKMLMLVQNMLESAVKHDGFL